MSLLAMTHRNCRNVFLQDAEIASQAASGKRKLDPVPSSYHKKYEHLLGREAAKDAARATDANKSYGFGTVFKNAFWFFYIYCCTLATFFHKLSSHCFCRHRC